VKVIIIEAESDFVSDVGNLNDRLSLESSKRDVLKLPSGSSEVSQSSAFVVTLNDLAESIDSWATKFSGAEDNLICSFT
jgi:DNA helicase TIP49 (TBP-interacting protein)